MEGSFFKDDTERIDNKIANYFEFCCLCDLRSQLMLQNVYVDLLIVLNFVEM